MNNSGQIPMDNLLTVPEPAATVARGTSASSTASTASSSSTFVATPSPAVLAPLPSLPLPPEYSPPDPLSPFADPNKAYPDAAPSYELPSYGDSNSNPSNGTTPNNNPSYDYHTYEPPQDEEIPDYAPRGRHTTGVGLADDAVSTTGGTSYQPDETPDGKSLSLLFKRSFRSARLVCFIAAVVTAVMAIVGVVQANNAKSGTVSGMSGLWAAVGVALSDVVLSFPLLIPYIADFPAEPSPVPKVVRYAAFEDGAMMGAYLASALLSPYCYQGDS